MTQSHIEDRLSTLERTVAELVGKQDSPKPKGDWRSTIGMFAGDPVIREMSGVQTRISEYGSPTWEIAYLFPNQGTWAEEEYLSLGGDHLIEFSDGFVHVLPMPTDEQQQILAVLFEHLNDYVTSRNLGTVLFAPMRVQVAEGHFRQPNIFFLSAEHNDRRSTRYCRGADLVIHVVNEEDPDDDFRSRYAEYALAGIAEYWIVDLRDQTILLFPLDADCYDQPVGGHFTIRDTVRSVLLDGFSIPVSEVFAHCDTDS
jgi:Uma2 family endonuclease